MARLQPLAEVSKGLKVENYGGKTLKEGGKGENRNSSSFIENLKKALNLSDGEQKSLMEALKDFRKSLDERNKALDQINKEIDSYDRPSK